MSHGHSPLLTDNWQRLSLIEQLANIGSEVERAIKWRKKNTEYFNLAFARAIELLDLTIADKKNMHRLKEIVRVREALADYFLFDNIYGSSDEKWHKYFYCFNYAARRST